MAGNIIIGGTGYRWKGRSIRAVNHAGANCVSLPRKDSLVLAEVSLVSEKRYVIKLIASKNSGNGAVLVNIFAGQGYDGLPAAVNINSSMTSEFQLIVSAPKMPNNLKVYLRIYRPNNATGNVFIKTITISEQEIKTNITLPPRVEKTVLNRPINQPKERTREPARVKSPQSIYSRQTPNKKIKKGRKEKPPEKRKKLPKENREMKFKPYGGRMSESAAELIIKSATDVPMVSIITPTRDGIELMKRCYEAVNKNTSYPNWEWIIGDSASTDGTVEYIESLNDNRIKLIKRGTVEGSFSTINNELVKRAAGEYLLFLNNDTRVEPFWMFEMMSKIHNKPEIGIVGAKLLYPDKNIQHAGIAFIPQGPANIGHSVLKSFPAGFANYDRYLQAVTGACLLIRRADFDAVGGFDPVFWYCYEDVDLCLKIKKQLNKKILYAANAVVFHDESVTQKKHSTAGELQRAGIKAFKDRWMHTVEIDLPLFQRNMGKGIKITDLSFVTCVNDVAQYRSFVVGSLFNTSSNKNYEIVPIYNYGNIYSASQALNKGMDKARGKLVIMLHQDVLLYPDWIDILYKRVSEIEKKDKSWGVLGVAGINEKDTTVGVVHNVKGALNWQSSVNATVYPVQTLDEVCIIIKKDSGLRFDEKNLTGYHFYSCDICLAALNKGRKNYGILNPLIHGSASGSLGSGREEFMRLLNVIAKKWGRRFSIIRTSTSIIRNGIASTFIKF